MVSGPVGLFLIAHLLFPEPMDGANIREYYYGIMRPVWLLGLLTVVSSTVFRPLIFGEDLYTPDNASSLVYVFGFIALAIFETPDCSRYFDSNLSGTNSPGCPPVDPGYWLKLSIRQGSASSTSRFHPKL